VQQNEQASLSYLANPYELFSEHRNSLVLSYACCEIANFYAHINCKLAWVPDGIFSNATILRTNNDRPFKGGIDPHPLNGLSSSP